MKIDRDVRDPKTKMCLREDCFTAPNLISMFRIILIFPCIYLLYHNNYIWTAILLFISGLSDMLDGIIARNFNQVTKLGQILDPIADKLTLSSVIFCLAMQFKDIIPIAVVLIVKDFSMLIAGIDLINKKIDPPPAKWYGKLATILFYVSAIVIVGLKAFFDFNNFTLTFFLLGVTTFTMIYALLRYFLVYLELLKRSKNEERMKGR